MPTIKFAKGRTPLDVPNGANLMKVLQDAEIPVASSCGGDGVCVKCRIRIVEGGRNLSKENELEQDLREIHDVARDERISCQVEVLGDITIDASYW